MELASSMARLLSTCYSCILLPRVPQGTGVPTLPAEVCSSGLLPSAHTPRYSHTTTGNLRSTRELTGTDGEKMLVESTDLGRGVSSTNLQLGVAPGEITVFFEYYLLACYKYVIG